MDLEALLAQVANAQSLSDPELGSLLDSLRAASATLLEEQVENATDEGIASLEAIAQAIDAVLAEQASREEEANAKKAKVSGLADRIKQSLGDPDGDPEGDPAETEGEPGENVEVEAQPAGPAEQVKEPIAAGGAPPRIGRVTARRPEMSKPKPASQAPVAITAAASADGIRVGEDVTGDWDKIATLFLSQWQASQGYRGPEVKVPVIRLGRGQQEFPDDRFLDGNLRRNGEKIEAVTSPTAIAASGGICAPVETRYDLPILPPSESRPVRDALTRFGADRGGVRLLPPPVLTDVTGAVDDWTYANDVSPSDPATKPCITVVCPSPVETTVDAITRCLEFGNFNARYFPEQIEAWTRLTAGWFARHAETKHLTTIGTGSTQVTTGVDILGATRDVLARWELAATALRNRHRLPATFPLRLMFPSWLLNLIRVDIARGITVGTLDETLALAEAQIIRWIENLGLNVSNFLDGETGQVFGAQGDGLLNPWIDSVVSYMYPEGSWLFLDGGTLDLGIVRDSTLNATNDFRVFAESFEQVAFHGVESLRITIDICASGAMQGTVSQEDITCTTAGGS